MIEIASFFGENANPGNGTGTLLMGTTTDGKTWTAIPSWTSTAAVRDPSITLINGLWAIVYTGGVPGSPHSFGLMTSSFIGDPWLNMTDVDVAAIATGTAWHSWAPEWFIDPADNSLHVLLVISTSSNVTFTDFDFYEIHPATNTNGSINLGSWSIPVQLLTNSASFPLGPSGKYRLDPNVVFRNSTYYLWYAQESVTGSPIGLASSTALLGTYTCIDDQYSFTKGWTHHVEGPNIINRQGTWWAYADNYGVDDNGNATDNTDGGRIIYSTSTDTWATWGSSTVIGYPNWPQVKHATMFLNGSEYVSGTKYNYYNQSYHSIANNGTATNSVEYVWGQTDSITSTSSIGTAGLITGGGNLTGYKGNTAARFGGG
jgi:hypothetical protein